jgi:low molecular weight protein-tyrosine phosphatase
VSAPNVPPPRAPGPYRVQFVCTGNICRSPMAEVVLRHLAAGAAIEGSATLGQRLEVSSAGTGPWHEGEPMDTRAHAALRRHGYPPGRHVAHQVQRSRLGELDLVVALDRRHHETLRGLGRGSLDGRLVMLRAFDADAGGAQDVPDPYYGDDADFTRCLLQVESACRGLAAALAETVGASVGGS